MSFILGYVTTNMQYITLVEDSMENVQILKSRDSELCVLMVRSSSSTIYMIHSMTPTECNPDYLAPVLHILVSVSSLRLVEYPSLVHRKLAQPIHLDRFFQNIFEAI